MKQKLLFFGLLLLTAACGTGDNASHVDMSDYESDNAKKLAANNIPVPPETVVEVTTGLQDGATGQVLVTMSSKQSIAQLETWYQRQLADKGYSIRGPELVRGNRQLTASGSSSSMTIQFFPQPDGSTNISLSTSR